MAEKLTKTQLKKILSEMPKNELICLLLDLYTTSSVIKDLVNMKLNPKVDWDEIISRYEKKINKIVTNPYRFSLQAVKGVVKETKEQYGNDSPIYYETVLIAAEWLDWFTESFGDIDDSFYTCLANYYGVASEAAKKYESLRSKFAPRLYDLNQSFRGMGWGMCDVPDAEWDSYVGYQESLD